MGFAPIGVTGDDNKKSECLKELKKMREYLLEHPEEKTVNGKTLQEIELSITSNENFQFLS